MKLTNTAIALDSPAIKKSPITFIYNGSAIPHADTERASYTVPAGKTAVLKSVSLGLTRAIAATVALNAKLTLSVTPNGGSKTAVCEISGGASNTLLSQTISQDIGLALSGGDVVTLDSSDGSTIGTVVYNASAIIIEIG